MRSVYLLTLIGAFSVCGWSQNLPVGHRTITFNDPNRGGRPIPSELYYPANAAGESTPVRNGYFPVVVFGHGFQMAFDSYAYFTNAMVPAGYIVVYPKTETSLAPSHAEYGADLAFLVVQMQDEGQNPISPFFQHIDSTSAIMGHSMGGGASFLGCKNNSTPTVMVTWAAAETNPSAIAAARNVTIPSLVFSADLDCVTPPAANQVPMYDSLAGDCKIFINVKGGGHCYFADANFICSLGELGCPTFTITRIQQHATTLDFTKLYLDHYLKNQSGAWVAFIDSLNSSSRITFRKSCTTTSVDGDVPAIPFRFFPNPSRNFTTLTGTSAGSENLMVSICDISGTKIMRYEVIPEKNRFRLMLDMTSWARGIYIAKICSNREQRVVKIVKN